MGQWVCSKRVLVPKRCDTALRQEFILMECGLVPTFRTGEQKHAIYWGPDLWALDRVQLN